MTGDQKAKIKDLCRKGEGYKKIAQIIGLSENTVKSFCRRSAISRQERAVPIKPYSACECCGKKVEHISGTKKRRFCSDACHRSAPSLQQKGQKYRFLADFPTAIKITSIKEPRQRQYFMGFGQKILPVEENPSTGRALSVFIYL